MPRDEEFIKKLLSIFKVEASEHISSISSALFALEKNLTPDEQRDKIEIIYRSAHSLKGASRSVSLGDVESLCQSMEDLLSMVKRGGVTLTDDIKNLLNDSNDLLAEMLSTDEADYEHKRDLQLKSLKLRLSRITAGGGRLSVPEHDINRKEIIESEHGKDELIDKIPLSDIIKDRRKKTEQRSVVNKSASAAVETIRISSAKLESLLMKAEELVAVKLSARHYSSEIEDMQKILVSWNKEWIQFFNVLKRNQKENYIIESGIAAGNNGIINPEDKNNTAIVKDFIRFNETQKNDFENRMNNLKKIIDDDFRSTGGLVDDLLGEMKNILLMPFSYTFEVFPKIVRDISREQEKEIELILEGLDVEIDKRVLQEMKDPFIHLVRNCIDHGIEIPAIRRKNGKPDKGLITVSVNQIDSGRVEIIVSDDGSGIDIERLKSSALNQEILTSDQSEILSDEQLMNLIFESGVSTSSIITTVSGRGLGMAIVKEKIEKLGGSVYVESVPGKGTDFHIILPVTIATFRGILMTCGPEMFVVPTKNVEKILKVDISGIKTIENRETIIYKGDVISLVMLEDILEIPQSAIIRDKNFLNVMILPSGTKFIAFVIDEVLNEDEMLFKNTGKQLQRVRNISGATVLVSGEVVMILNTGDIIKSASKSILAFRHSVSDERIESRKKKSILVVEDSITARSLYVNILEAVGYSVSAAVDGNDGFTKLINGDFDLVVTDVQMPKMSGFDLTAKIRNNARYADIPVVLVTGMESAEDKKRGIEAGANAYIVKSSFDQNNLLEVIERFI